MPRQARAGCGKAGPPTSAKVDRIPVVSPLHPNTTAMFPTVVRNEKIPFHFRAEAPKRVNVQGLLVIKELAKRKTLVGFSSVPPARLRQLQVLQSLHGN